MGYLGATVAAAAWLRLGLVCHQGAPWAARGGVFGTMLGSADVSAPSALLACQVLLCLAQLFTRLVKFLVIC